MLGTYSDTFGVGLFGGAFMLAILFQSLAVTVRRLHDIGLNGWWILVALIPFIGGIILLVMMIFDGQEGENKYGPNPKQST